ncbi:HlyD family efflux transporter periplasmic adaptor subunit [Herbaspirillum sp. AP02]|uniref:HlyD family efflux transporter periplasmic adaptor subunit n=1 Tax=unclassified Herbaspirillum TaxID=2624150 RepID=UPI0015DA7C14|nr:MULTISPECIES: HlyD family efflux transporter periplasmic adaptor subunit [unclassified Herbaspirillum]MBG7621514.1 HlyD family efflux transporter periplasmic adaptor subunit [Herbaspirillum sp. AP02]NZD69601.1 HlyD family efflux transporter periplasmic adaptor subunit [Herbaspirillum sp. AP21]
MSHSDSQATQTLADDAKQRNEAAAQAASAQKRKKLFSIFGGVVAIAAIGYGTYWYLIGSRYVETDNAYTATEIATVTPAVNGIVSAVDVVDTQAVKKGQVLVRIDDADARLAVDQAAADLDRTERKVKGFFANDAGLAAQVLAREADQKRAGAQLLSAQADLKRAEIDLQRREALAKSGSVSGEELSNARTALLTAQANQKAAEAAEVQSRANIKATQGAQKASTVLTANTTVDDNPEVVLARAKLDQAKLDLERTVLRAPVDGVIARRQVQVGQRVQSGAALLSVVPLQQMHVDANFKEGQLTKVRIGQPVTMKADLYGGSVEYHGVVTGLSGGTGSAFAVIPAQNATGNWIKVVQRLPVRISLDPKELAQRPLSVGLSMVVEIDTRGQMQVGDAQPKSAQNSDTKAAAL